MQGAALPRIGDGSMTSKPAWLAASLPVHSPRYSRLFYGGSTRSRCRSACFATPFAAAIGMGERALAAKPFDWRVMMTAMAVRFALSVAYALAAAVRRLGALDAIGVGAGFGLLLYGVNMDGFTFIFPWFSDTRDRITLAAHIVFDAM